MFTTKRKKIKRIFYNPDNRKRDILTVVSKGNRQEIDLIKLESTIIRLSKNYSYKIQKLVGNLKKDYDQIVRYVNLLYGGKHYPVLIDLINKHFKKHKNNIRAGTIAGYMYGCSIHTNMDNDACSSICAGSVKMSNDDPFCDFPVVIAQYENSNFKFYSQNGPNKQTKVALVHIEHSSLSLFPGFNDNEKEWFRRKGYNYIYLYGSTGNGKYNNLYQNNSNCESDGSMKVDEIKSRIGIIEDSNLDQGTFNFGTSVIVVVVIIIILLLTLFIYKYYSQKKSI
uniref:Uncharacterized protein n=1 Tax=Pithovirus LCPAC001 TaxID=2506585 RepID=A0A481Z4D3_9VIRU|nr:MAG: uncharacterized protein LCPAC001_00100 [Pithovirus LCPAC001]